jgi:hypothetical protein
MGEQERAVTFANGMRRRQLIVDIDDAARRLAYASVGGPSQQHHNASMQVTPASSGSRIAAPLMKQTLESAFTSAQRNGDA